MNPHDDPEALDLHQAWDASFDMVTEMLPRAPHILTCTTNDHIGDLVDDLGHNPLRPLVLAHLGNNLGAWRVRARRADHHPYPGWRTILSLVNIRMARSGQALNDDVLLELGRVLDLAETLAAESELDWSGPKVLSYLQLTERVGQDPRTTALALLVCARAMIDFDVNGAPRTKDSDEQ